MYTSFSIEYLDASFESHLSDFYFNDKMLCGYWVSLTQENVELK